MENSKVSPGDATEVASPFVRSFARGDCSPLEAPLVQDVDRSRVSSSSCLIGKSTRKRVPSGCSSMAECDLIDGVALDLTSADRAERAACARPEEAHVVPDLGGRWRTVGARVARGVFLADGDGGGDAHRSHPRRASPCARETGAHTLIAIRHSGAGLPHRWCRRRAMIFRSLKRR